MKTAHAKELEEETAQLRKEKEVIIADTVQKYEASISKMTDEHENKVKSMNE
jgi:hypothetical protein